MKYEVSAKSFPMDRPFAITGHTFTSLDAVFVTLTDGEHTGRGEGDGVYYLDETQEGMLEQLEGIREQVEKGISRESLQDLLPAGGARNAIDCALWDLEAKKSGGRIWDLLDLKPRTLTTVATVGMGTPQDMAARALEFSSYPNLKIKLDNQEPIQRLEAIRKARPDAALVIDVNQGWTLSELKELLPALEKLGVAMIEQPLARGEDQELEGFVSAIPLGADESCLTLSEYEVIKDRYQVINVKLDKTGGLTEALKIVQAAKADGKSLMVGNMMGTSLAMAPAYVIGQFCSFVDIDGPLLLADDVENPLNYLDAGLVSPPSAELWG